MPQKRKRRTQTQPTISGGLPSPIPVKTDDDYMREAALASMPPRPTGEDINLPLEPPVPRSGPMGPTRIGPEPMAVPGRISEADLRSLNQLVMGVGMGGINPVKGLGTLRQPLKGPAMRELLEAGKQGDEILGPAPAGKVRPEDMTPLEFAEWLEKRARANYAAKQGRK